MSTQISDVTRPEGINDRVWSDFVRVHVNGERPKDVAEGRAAATVSANVKRVREKLGVSADDAAPRQNGEGGTTTTTAEQTALSQEDRYKIADEMMPPFGRMYVHERERIESSKPTDSAVKKAEEALTKAQDALAEAQARLASDKEQHDAQMVAFTEAAQAAGFDFDAYAEKVAQAEEEARVEAAKAAAETPSK